MQNLKTEQHSFTNPTPLAAKKIMLVTGEASGDHHGAELVKSLLNSNPSIKIFGMGGSLLRQAGMETIVDSEKSASVMGFTELLGSLKGIFSALNTLKTAVKERQPDIVILIDFPDFNLHLAKFIAKLKIPIVYYVPPQIWAWRTSRVFQIKKYITKVLSIFPFEEAFYKKHAVDVEFVGHPFLDKSKIEHTKSTFFLNYGLNPQVPTLALLPGSRKSEIERLLKPMLGAFKKLKIARPGLQAIIPVAPNISFQWLENFIKDYKDVYLVPSHAREVLTFSDCAIVTSGTATVEAALTNVPFIAIYKLSKFSHFVAKRLVKGVKNFAMANLIAGKQIVPELLQEQVNVERIAFEVEKILGDPSYSAKLRNNLKLVENSLRNKNKEETASEKAAKLTLKVIKDTQHE